MNSSFSLGRLQTGERARTDEAGDTILEPGDAPAPSLYLPQSVAGVFDEAFDLYKRHFLTLALLAAVLFVPTQFVLHGVVNAYLRPLAATIDWRSSDPQVGAAFTVIIGYFLTGYPEYAIPGFLSLTALALASGPVAIAVADIVAGQRPTLRSCYARGWRKMPRLFSALVTILLTAICVLIGAFILVWTVAGLIVGLIGSVINLNILGSFEEVISFLSLAISTLPYFACCAVIARSYIFAFPLIALEDSVVANIATRNTLLVGKSRFRRIWCATLFLPLVVIGLQALILLSVGVLVESLHLAPMWTFTLQGGLFTLVSFFFQPYWMVFVTLLYYDARIRREGYDVRMLGAYLPVFDPMSATTDTPMAPTSPSLPDPMSRTMPLPTPMPMTGTFPPSAPSLPPMPTSEGRRL